MIIYSFLLNRSFAFSFSILLFILLFHGCRSTEIVVDNETPPETETVVEETPEPVIEAKLSVFSPDEVPAPVREFRAAWVATVANIDWPSEPGLPVEQQQKEMIDLLNRAAALHFNAIILQVRPAADAIYNSSYEPWSYYLTGKMGEPPLPAYDPLKFAVREAHKRGMELHAWFNPYRALHPTHRSAISPDHISKINPEYVLEYGNFLWLDPGNTDAMEHTLRVILDVVERYDIDGVHFDDYFYPYPSYAGGADFPDSHSWQLARNEGTTLSRGDWRRENVNTLMKELSGRIKVIKPHVKFGISPFGIWRPGFPVNTTGFDAYENLYADARLWLNEGWVDYFTPQIYYRIDQVPQPFPVMLEWWLDQNHHNRHMWPGLYTSRVRTTDGSWPQSEITGQVYTSRGFPGVSGTVHFSMRTFMENPGNFNQKMAAGPHAFVSAIPGSAWMGETPSAIPGASVHDYGNYWTLQLSAPQGDVQWWVVRSKFGDIWEIEIFPGHRHEVTYYGGNAMARPDSVLISYLNRVALESPVVEPENNLIQTAVADTISVDKPDIISRKTWGKEEPGGYHANAVRRNLMTGDTLRFRDLTIVSGGLLMSAPFPEGLLKSDEFQQDNNGEATESATLRLYKNGVSESRSLKKGDAFNWFGYHIGLLETNFESGMIQLEVATVNSLPVERAALFTTGGANQRLRVPHNIKKITLHHMGTAEPVTAEDDPKNILNGLYEWGAAARNWWDVPYHYFIGPDDTIYEGRDSAYAGDTNTTYDPRGHLLISVMGNYNLQEPSEDQIRAIAALMAYSIEKYGLTINDIYMHSDWADTNCPGEFLSPFLKNGTLQQMIEEKLNIR